MEASDWDRRYADQALLWSAEPNRFVAEELAESVPGRALDLAAGEGRNAIWLAERGWEVEAVDFSAVAIDRGRGLAERRGVEAKWQVADVRTLALSGDYDLVLIAYLHLPWSAMRAVIRRAAEAVAPGGLFLLVGHDRQNLEHGHGGPRDPSVLYGPEDVVSELDGFEVEKAERLRRKVATDEGSVEAIDNLVRAIRRCAL